MTSKPRVLSGMRPTGKLHLGNYLGALEHWVRMQDDYECFFFVASWHALTTAAHNSGQAPESTIEMAADWLGAGLDPQRSTLFIQSLVPEHAELHLLFSMVTPLGWLERVPTYKEMVEQLGLESPSYGLLGYPLLQAADILMYKPQWVPVGIDQVPHVELTSEGARRFNNTWKPVFPEPGAKAERVRRDPPGGLKDGARFRQEPHGGGPRHHQSRAMSGPAITPETDSQGLTVRVESFVGPLDLLLHLCRTNEVDLANLPIRTITEQYLAHLESVQFQDLESAGGFPLLAAPPVPLKSNLHLPRQPDP